MQIEVRSQIRRKIHICGFFYKNCSKTKKKKNPEKQERNETSKKARECNRGRKRPNEEELGTSQSSAWLPPLLSRLPFLFSILFSISGFVENYGKHEKKRNWTLDQQEFGLIIKNIFFQKEKKNIWIKFDPFFLLVLLL